MARKGLHHFAVSPILSLQVIATAILEVAEGLPFNPANHRTEQLDSAMSKPLL
jgi:hypothetical protein